MFKLWWSTVWFCIKEQNISDLLWPYDPSFICRKLFLKFRTDGCSRSSCSIHSYSNFTASSRPQAQLTLAFWRGSSEIRWGLGVVTAVPASPFQEAICACACCFLCGSSSAVLASSMCIHFADVWAYPSKKIGQKDQCLPRHSYGFRGLPVFGKTPRSCGLTVKMHKVWPANSQKIIFQFENLKLCVWSFSLVGGERVGCSCQS